MIIKAIIMDLGDTIVNNVDFQFNKGLQYLHEEILKPIEFLKLREIANELKLYGYDQRCITTLEVPFIHYLDFLKQMIGFRHEVSNLSLEEIEQEFMLRASNDIIMDDIKKVLDFFIEQSIPIYVLSNSTFSSKTLKYQLSKFELLNYFEKVYSSADFIFRKPNPLLFKMAIASIINDYPMIDKNDIFFIGNDYDKDILGAYDSGIRPIWLNQNNQKNINNIPCITINNYQDLLNIFKSNNLILDIEK